MQNREAWLKERKSIITASDVASIIGLPGAYKTNLDVYADKISDDVSESDLRHLRIGRRMEGIIADEYAHETGWIVSDLGATEIVKHPDIPWLGATLDRMTRHPDDEIFIPLEIKNVGNMRIKRKDFAVDPPMIWQCQNLIQMACTASHAGRLAGMFNNTHLEVADLGYDNDFFKSILPALDEFINHNVAKRIPPRLIEHPKMLDSIKGFYSDEDGETKILEGGDIRYDVRLWEDFKAEISSTEKAKKEAESRIREKMGTATFGSLSDGTLLSLKTTTRKAKTHRCTRCGYETEISKESSYRVLRRVKR